MNKPQSSPGLKMLVVDDEPNVCFTLKLIFEQEGFAVATAASASEAIKALNNGQRFDLVVTDLHMEREDAGFDVVRVAKKLKPPPIVIVVTGYANVSNARIALNVQVDHFAVKPIEIPDFLEAIRRLAGWRTDVRHAG
jgi:CheY-like chemotaxis protein